MTDQTFSPIQIGPAEMRNRIAMAPVKTAMAWYWQSRLHSAQWWPMTVPTRLPWRTTGGGSIGLLRIDPPVYLFASLAAIVVLHLFLPAFRIISAPWNLLGVVPLVAGIVLNLMADRSFKIEQNPVKPLGEPKALITRGVFRISRHPMYLGFGLILLGAAFLAGSATPFLEVAAFLVFIDSVFVRFEETKLARTFGSAWLDSKADVRKWI